MKRAWKGYALIAPMLAGFLLFYVVPFGQVMWDSLSQGTGKSQLFVGFYNYQRMFQNKMFLAAFGNTLKFLGLGLPLVLLLAYGLALFLKSRARRSPVLRGVFLLPYVSPWRARCCSSICCSRSGGLSTGCFWPWGCLWRTGSSPRRPSG